MTPLEIPSPSVRTATELAPAKDAVNAVSALPSPPHSARVSISGLGQALSKTDKAQGRYKDIDDSDLPDATKQLLRMIRDLRQMLEQLTQELQRIQADKIMPAEAKRIRLLQLNAQMSAVNGALIQATQKLASMMRDTKMDQSQQMTAGQLALR